MHCTQGWKVGYHEKYMNGGNTSVFKMYSASSTMHPHENNGATRVYHSKVGLGDMAQKIITIIIFISVDIDNYHDKCQIFISFKFIAIFLLQSESFTNQTINCP